MLDVKCLSLIIMTAYHLISTHSRRHNLYHTIKVLRLVMWYFIHWQLVYTASYCLSEMFLHSTLPWKMACFLITTSFLAVFFNVLLLPIILFRSSVHIGNYKYLLFAYTLIATVYSIVQLVQVPVGLFSRKEQLYYKCKQKKSSIVQRVERNFEHVQSDSARFSRLEKIV